MGETRWSSLAAKIANRRELAVERAAKKEAIEALNGVFKATSVAIVAHYSGLTVAQMQKLRMQMKQAGASVKVSKNRLAKIALEGTDVVAIGSLLKGPTVIATSNDPVAAPKVAVEFAKTNEQFVILGGSMGKTVLNVEQRQGACLAAVTRRTARQDRRPPGGAGDQDRSALDRARGQARARHSGLCLKERSGLRPFANQTWFEPIRLRKQING